MEKEILATLRAIELSSYSFCAATALYAHHFVTTIGAEVECVWSAPWTTMKILYLINRYFGLAVVISNTALAWLQTAGHISCNSFHFFVATVVTILILVVQMILQVRARAILKNKRAHVNAITALFVLEIGSVVGLSVRYSKAATMRFLKIEFCDTRLSLSLVPAMAFDAVVALVIVYKAVRHTIQRRHMDIPASWGYGGRLLVTLTRDSIQYYICILFVFTVVVLRDFKASDAFDVPSLILFPWVTVVPTASATCMILRLHRAARTGGITTSPTRASTVIELDEIVPDAGDAPLRSSCVPGEWAQLTLQLSRAFAGRLRSRGDGEEGREVRSDSLA
ncbi:hypothetical protein OE88DRAFT_1355627 [Heliocybe sulcata]|uniref:DUF6533 domain-containing protein n=1 Tax=Heliocybe sulcata TaxID=5364 RepID=A0A5C3N7J7_9AGAM|nr:hypothetical protein OE88DRAFT_1355627 [Heliocybe sulcata]